MAPRFLTLLTGRNLPKTRQPREPDHQRKDDRGFCALAEQYASHMEPAAGSLLKRFDWKEQFGFMDSGRVCL
jgi:hypothetical protein